MLHGCEVHDHPSTGSTFDPECTECWEQITDQRENEVQTEMAFD